jgi:hypothetical protein
MYVIYSMSASVSSFINGDNPMYFIDFFMALKEILHLKYSNHQIYIKGDNFIWASSIVS